MNEFALYKYFITELLLVKPQIFMIYLQQDIGAFIKLLHDVCASKEIGSKFNCAISDSNDKEREIVSGSGQAGVSSNVLRWRLVKFTICKSTLRQCSDSRDESQ